MNVNGSGSMQQTQMHTQMRKMDGTGGGKGKGGENGMSDVMSGLSEDNQTAISEQLKSLSSEDRKAMKDEIKSIDKTNMSSDEYAQAIMSVLNPESQTSTAIYA